MLLCLGIGPKCKFPHMHMYLPILVIISIMTAASTSATSLYTGHKRSEMQGSIPRPCIGTDDSIHFYLKKPKFSSCVIEFQLVLNSLQVNKRTVTFLNVSVIALQRILGCFEMLCLAFFFFFQLDVCMTFFCNRNLSLTVGVRDQVFYFELFNLRFNFVHLTAFKISYGTRAQMIIAGNVLLFEAWTSDPEMYLYLCIW